jgi:hypothetical protein
MKGKTRLIFVATIVLAMALVHQVNAQSLAIYGYSDRVQYGPGDSGSIKFWVFNNDAIPITIENVTIEFPWSYPGLGGNYTIKGIGVTLTKGQNWTSTQSFTIPNDGRANALSSSSSATITAYYEYSVSSVVSSSSYSGYVTLNIAAAPYPTSIEDLQTLLTITIIMILIAAIIIAVAIFMTKRSPQATSPK